MTSGSSTFVLNAPLRRQTSMSHFNSNNLNNSSIQLQTQLQLQQQQQQQQRPPSPLPLSLPTLAGPASLNDIYEMYGQVYRQIETIKKSRAENELVMREREELVKKYKEELEDMYKNSLKYKVRINEFV